MTSARSRIAVALATSTLVLASAHAQTAERPCRIVLDSVVGGGADPSIQHGEIQLGPVMRQSDGSLIIMGQGSATIKYGPEPPGRLSDGCKVVKGQSETVSMTAVVSSADGRNAEIDIISMAKPYEVVFDCPDLPGTPLGARTGGEMKTKVSMITPDTVTMPLVHGATKAFDDSDGRVTHRGTLSLHYCRPDPSARPPAQ